ncbi:MAG: hypothetical protein U0Z53_01530 [Blastocatellia bacterium]
MTRYLRLTIGGLALLLGGIALPFELLALIDPVGTKMSDDGDPFGPPPGWQQHAIYLTVIGCLFLLGFVLLHRKTSKPK